MGVKISGEYLGGLAMRMCHGPSGVTIETDPPVDNGGRGASFSPTDLLATSYGACMMSIMAIAAQKEKIDLNGMRIDIEKHMSSDQPRRVVRLDVTLVLPAHLDQATAARLVNAGRNCPVAKSISPDILINFNIQKE